LIDKPLAGAVKIWDGYPPGNDHLSHLGKRNIMMCFGDMGYVSFEEGIYYGSLKKKVSGRVVADLH